MDENEGLLVQFAATKLSIASAVDAALPSFLGLPPEVRNKIYELILMAEEPIPLRIQRAWYVRQRYRSLVHVCRQTLRESQKLYYSRNTFVLPKTVNIGDWLDDLSGMALCVQRVEVPHRVLECHLNPPTASLPKGATTHPRVQAFTQRPDAQPIKLDFVLADGDVEIGAVSDEIDEVIVETARQSLRPVARFLAVR
ncbi:hypothetical protein LTR78_009106 [Recurvomyces mirabilis]|uniref:Uncharacterized protein n=1 Tax=Recurvomyces mirabilis TaxID=574656 RepID=A0AAE0WIK5_9PEZI|nr:hypothetical protein LTR78_009106 [Recurvomyces mirabilis]KAK5161044.1 hypothetical protein LTS14_000838 [Recurvomyces mirabilis]